MNNLVEIKVFMYRYDAEIAKDLLKQQGINSIISGDDCGGLSPYISLGMGNFKLLVQKENVNKSKEVLKILE